MKIRIKKLLPNVQLPTRAYEHAAAWDVVATSRRIVNEKTHGYIEYGTGIAVEIPVEYCIKLFPRSSVSNTGLILANSVGLIDPDYRGEILFRYKWIKDTKMYEIGETIGQIRLEKTIPIEWVEVDELSDSKRGDGGFGSSDKPKE